MTVSEAAPHRNGFTGDDHSRLKALLDKEFLVGAGWDWETMVLSPPADHPTLGSAICRVPGCEALVEHISKGVCRVCAHRMARSGSNELPDFCTKTYTVGVGLCAVGCARPWESRRRPLCAAHGHLQGTVLQIPIDEFLARPDLRPLPGFGPCSVLACTRLRYNGTSPFCKAHHRRWTLAAGADEGLSLDRWCRTESAVVEAGKISLRGLAERVVAEVLYGLQQRCAENIKTHRAVLRPLCDELRRTQVGSITDLPEQTRRQHRYLQPVPGRALPARPVLTGDRTSQRHLGSAGVRPSEQPGFHDHRAAVVADGRQAVDGRGPTEAAGDQRPQHVAIHPELTGRAVHQPPAPARRPRSRPAAAGTTGHRRLHQPAGLPPTVRHAQPQPAE